MRSSQAAGILFTDRPIPPELGILGGFMPVAASRPLPVLLILGALVGCKEPPPPPPPPPEVVVQPVDVRDTPVQAEFTGEIRGGEDVEVRARVAGYPPVAELR